MTLPDEAFDKPIEEKKVSDVQVEPYALPAQYNWVNLDLEDDATMQEIYELLVINYVEDDDAMFRFDYSVPFLRWALQTPEGHKEWIVGVRGGKK